MLNTSDVYNNLTMIQNSISSSDSEEKAPAESQMNSMVRDAIQKRILELIEENVKEIAAAKLFKKGTMILIENEKMVNFNPAQNKRQNSNDFDAIP